MAKCFTNPSMVSLKHLGDLGDLVYRLIFHALKATARYHQNLNHCFASLNESPRRMFSNAFRSHKATLTCEFISEMARKIAARFGVRFCWFFKHA